LNRFKAGDVLIFRQDKFEDLIYILLEDEREFSDDKQSGCLSLILKGKGVYEELPGQVARLRGLITYSQKYFK
jgi:hypothetical protein